jgi:hypothetical protein
METQKILEFLQSQNMLSTGAGPAPSLETDRFVWSFSVHGIDKLGVLVSRLTIKAKGTPSVSMKKQAELVSARITYLEEAFKMLEHDSDQQTLYLRSAVTQPKKDETHYFEIVLKGGTELSLAHYEVARGTSQRRLTPANLSRRTFERLLGDLQKILA